VQPVGSYYTNITKIFSFYSVTFTNGDNLQLHVDISPLPVVNVSNTRSMHIPVTSYKWKLQ